MTASVSNTGPVSKKIALSGPAEIGHNPANQNVNF
jgi:hypothetical protein